MQWRQPPPPPAEPSRLISAASPSSAAMTTSPIAGAGATRFSYCCCSANEKRNNCVDERLWFDSKSKQRRAGFQAAAALPFTSAQSQFASKQNSKPRRRPRCAPGNTGPQSPRDTPPKRDTGIANEKDWGISLLNEHMKESRTNEDGSTWYRESGEELGDTGYRCRWTRMGGASQDASSEWREE